VRSPKKFPRDFSLPSPLFPHSEAVSGVPPYLPFYDSPFLRLTLSQYNGPHLPFFFFSIGQLEGTLLGSRSPFPIVFQDRPFSIRGGFVRLGFLRPHPPLFFFFLVEEAGFLRILHKLSFSFSPPPGKGEFRRQTEIFSFPQLIHLSKWSLDGRRADPSFFPPPLKENFFFCYPKYDPYLVKAETFFPPFPGRQVLSFLLFFFLFALQRYLSSPLLRILPLHRVDLFSSPLHKLDGFRRFPSDKDLSLPFFLSLSTSVPSFLLLNTCV